jgi:hypothetical protein
MFTNYSGQPFEPVPAMQQRTGCNNVLYEEIDTLRIHKVGNDVKLLSIPYGVLRQTVTDIQQLGKLCRKLNASDLRGLKYSYTDADLIEWLAYLPDVTGTAIKLERLRQRYIRVNNVKPMFNQPRYLELKELAIDLEPGLYLCRYTGVVLPLKLEVFATSEDGLALVQMMYSLSKSRYWKYAIIDARETREVYANIDAPKTTPQFGEDFGDGQLTQDQINRLVGFHLNNM